MKLGVVLGIVVCAGSVLAGCGQTPRASSGADVGQVMRNSSSEAPVERPAVTPAPVSESTRSTAFDEVAVAARSSEPRRGHGIAPRVETFAGKRVVRISAAGFDALDALDRELAYCLVQATLSGRDILYDRRHPYNLAIRHTVERVLRSYPGDRSTESWHALETYAKEIWFSSGIHDAATGVKIAPDFSFDTFADWVRRTPGEFPMREGQSIDEWTAELRPVMFDPSVDFTIDESRHVDEAWRLGGRYSAAIEEMILWLERARDLARAPSYRERLASTVEQLKAGRVASTPRGEAAELAFDTANAVNWSPGILVPSVAHEVPCVTLRDGVACERSGRLVRELRTAASDGSSVSGFASRDDGPAPAVIDVVAAAAPLAPAAYGQPSNRDELATVFENLASVRSPGDPRIVAEFAWHGSEIERAAAHGELADELYRAVRDSVGRVSARSAVATSRTDAPDAAHDPAIVAAYADAVALHALLDPALVDLGVSPSLEVGRAAYDAYLRDGLLLSLRPIPESISWMQHDETSRVARRIVAHWIVETGDDRELVIREHRDNKTYFEIRDYTRLRRAFGELASQLERILRQRDTAAALRFVDAGTTIDDPELAAEVNRRFQTLDPVRQTGYTYPRFVGEDLGSRVLEIRIEPPADFLNEMLDLSDRYSLVPARP